MPANLEMNCANWPEATEPLRTSSRKWTKIPTRWNSVSLAWRRAKWGKRQLWKPHGKYPTACGRRCNRFSSRRTRPKPRGASVSTNGSSSTPSSSNGVVVADGIACPKSWVMTAPSIGFPAVAAPGRVCPDLAMLQEEWKELGDVAGEWEGINSAKTKLGNGTKENWRR